MCVKSYVRKKYSFDVVGVVMTARWMGRSCKSRRKIRFLVYGIPRVYAGKATSYSYKTHMPSCRIPTQEAVS